MPLFNKFERPILRLYAAGCSVDEISDRLENSPTTVNRNLRSAEQKAGLSHRGQLIPYMHQNPRVLLKGGRGAFGLHEPSETCHCRSCRMLRGEMPLAPAPVVEAMDTIQLHEASLTCACRGCRILRGEAA
jgi:DNA-binding CsgD family transcriptional regulator